PWRLGSGGAFAAVSPGGSKKRARPDRQQTDANSFGESSCGLSFSALNEPHRWSCLACRPPSLPVGPPLAEEPRLERPFHSLRAVTALLGHQPNCGDGHRGSSLVEAEDLFERRRPGV